jgi:hypothetical protein
MFRIILVGFLPTDDGRSCERHPFPYGCGNSWIYDSGYHGVGMQIRLRLVGGSHLAGYTVQVDGTDGCRVCFAAREYAVGSSGVRLDGFIFESGIRFSLTMRTPTSKLCFIASEDMRLWNCSNRTKLEFMQQFRRAVDFHRLG